MAQKYWRPTDLPLRIPVFPLRGAILLPRASLPLNVFEPRYLAMVDDVMSGSRIIGVVQPLAKDDEDESHAGNDAPLWRVGCAGRVTLYQEMDDERYVITITGVSRFELIEEVETGKPYRVAAARYDRFAQDFEVGHGEEMVDRQNLLRVLRLYLEANSLQADWRAIQRSSSESLINALSVMSPYGQEEKQALLEAPDLKARGDVLMALAEMELAMKGDSGGNLQ